QLSFAQLGQTQRNSSTRPSYKHVAVDQTRSGDLIVLLFSNREFAENYAKNVDDQSTAATFSGTGHLVAYLRNQQAAGATLVVANPIFGRTEMLASPIEKVIRELEEPEQDS